MTLIITTKIRKKERKRKLDGSKKLTPKRIDVCNWMTVGSTGINETSREKSTRRLRFAVTVTVTVGKQLVRRVWKRRHGEPSVHAP